MLFLPRQGDEQHRPQVADELHLGSRGLQGQDVVLVEQGHGLQSVVVPGVLAGVFIGNGVHGDLHHAGFARQVLRPDGHAVEAVGDGEGPGEISERLLRLALEVEVGGGLVEPELRDAVPGHRGGAVGEIDHLVVDTAVCQGRGAVQGVALHHAARRQAAVVIQCGVVGLVIGGGHAVAIGLRRRGGGEGQGSGQHKGQGAAEGLGESLHVESLQNKDKIKIPDALPARKFFAILS